MMLTSRSQNVKSATVFNKVGNFTKSRIVRKFVPLFRLVTIGPERRKILADYYSRSNDPNSRAVQNIFRGLTKSGLLVKCRKSDLIFK